MTPAVLNSMPNARLSGDRALTAAARFSWIAAVLGQAMFLFYIFVVYVPATLTGNFAAWPSMIKGYIPGDTVGNLAVGAHMLLAATVTFGGTLQLIPQIRRRVPKVHRWIGRLFLVAAIGAALGGIWMIWVRGATLGIANSYGTTGNAILILAFATLAWRTAIQRDFVSHRRWALRTFIVANGVWFLRVGAIGVGAAAMGLGLKIDQQAFFNVMLFACYLIPLAILELYFLAQSRGGMSRYAMAAGLTLATLLMSVGIVGAWFALFATAWSTVRRRAGTVGRFERAVVIVPLGIVALGLGIAAFGGKVPRPEDFATVYIFAVVSALSAIADLTMIRRGGLKGVPRVARHLWRMGAALFVATDSFFFGQAELLPTALRVSIVPSVLGLAPLVLMAFWIVRVRLPRGLGRLRAVS